METIKYPNIVHDFTLFKTGNGFMLNIQIVPNEIFNDHNDIED